MSTPAAPPVDQPPVPPVVRVLRGQPDEAEIAALVVVLAARAGAGRADSAAGRQDGGWSAHWRRVGAPPAPGPTTWRLSAR